MGPSAGSNYHRLGPVKLGQPLVERLQMAPHGDANYFENLNLILKEMKPSLLYQSQVIFRLCQRTS